MDESVKRALERITAQQPEKRDKIWMVGEQLKDMIRDHPRYGELVARDLELKDMSLAACEKKLDAFAKANGGCVIPVESDRIIREFYGLPPIDEDQSREAAGMVDLSDFF